MALVRCEALDGPRPGFKAVGVRSVEGHVEYLAVEERFLVRKGEAYFLPVGVVGNDPRHQTALVELPLEADSGANRVWVHADHLANGLDEVPA
jgi:hypothetical protein